jgi:hypothetical protein
MIMIHQRHMGQKGSFVESNFEEFYYTIFEKEALLVSQRDTSFIRSSWSTRDTKAIYDLHRFEKKTRHLCTKEIHKYHREVSTESSTS